MIFHNFNKDKIMRFQKANDRVLVNNEEINFTLSSTAPGSIPNLSAMGIIRSGRLTFH